MNDNTDTRETRTIPPEVVRNLGAALTELRAACEQCGLNFYGNILGQQEGATMYTFLFTNDILVRRALVQFLTSMSTVSGNNAEMAHRAEMILQSVNMHWPDPSAPHTKQ